MHRYLLVLLVAGCSMSDSQREDGPRGELGKADAVGSCAKSDCEGQATNGNCFCDDSCLGHGDCCSDKREACGDGVIFTTYNAGLAHGAVPFAAERVQPIGEALAESPADVMCLQEVWTDADAEAITEAVSGTFPHSFRHKTETTDHGWFACGTQLPSLLSMNSCVKEKCTPSGISAFECAADQCKPEWDALGDRCKLCLAANPLSPTTCAVGRASMFGQGGRNGLLLLSRTPIEKPSYMAFETFLIKRGVLRGDIQGLQVQCTHMTAQLDVVPYPSGGTFGSWREEHVAQIQQMAQQAGDRRTVMLGDLNAGPASPGVDAELPENYTKLLDADYRDTWTRDRVCTYCQDNPLVCSKPEGCGGLSSRLDHVLLRSFANDIALEFERFGDDPISVGGGRLSDHYGVTATLPY